MNDSKNQPVSLHFSKLTSDDLKTITEAEQKLNKQHSANHVLIAYDQLNGAEQSGKRV